MPTLPEKVKAFEKARAEMVRLSNEIVFELGLTGGLPIATVQSLPALELPKKKRHYRRRSSAAPADAAPVRVPVPAKATKRRRKRTKVTDAVRAEVWKLRGEKMSGAAIARKLGMAQNTAWGILSKSKPNP